jgi:type I restriction-modification system DNA methylase subunit
MSEELLQTVPFRIGRYTYYKLGSSTLTQLKQGKVINTNTPLLKDKKPDGLIVLPGGIVKAVIEYKVSTELSTQTQIKKAILQELAVAKLLCKVLIITDGEKSFWVNALNGELVTKGHRPIKFVFNAEKLCSGKLTTEEREQLESLIDQAEYSLSEINNDITEPIILDPTPLAKEVWQKIWINTGKEPEKCLYNVVEIFVFKFLSDIGVLDFTNNFNSVYEIKEKKDNIAALNRYATVCRKEIKNEMFPKGEDGTTIFNGTIFVNENGFPNNSQANLFGQVLDSFQKYDKKNGSFKYVTKEFKTRLYETFLRQSAGVKNLGQYFTPRNVIQAMVKISNANVLTSGSRICDPFCGVGGFVLEIITMTKSIYKEFEPKNGKINPAITILGFDKGTDEKDDERTIILAKANMLIYFSDLLARYHSKEHLLAFSKGAFNKVFHLLRSNLGTFGKTDEDPFDLILTNPPYVTSGSRTIKENIQNDDNKILSGYYQYNGRGTEALSIEWIIKNLKAGGQALVIVPDGLLLQRNLLTNIKRDCIIQGIISLPVRTFYSTPKKTYILILQKKHENNIQEQNIFTFLISEIGETRDTKRFFLKQNDLEEAVVCFNLFQHGATIPDSPRCRILTFNEFDQMAHWQIEQLWSSDERIMLGIEKEKSSQSLDDFKDFIDTATITLTNYKKQLEKIDINEQYLYKTLSLNDKEYFTLSIGYRVLKRDILENGIPLYSANVYIPFGYVKQSNISNFDKPSILWGIDGNFNWNYIEENIQFATTDHCGRLICTNKNIHPKYIYYMLKQAAVQYGFNRTFRASMTNLKELVTVDVPINKNGDFDLKMQEKIVKKLDKITLVQNSVGKLFEEIDNIPIEINFNDK